MTIEERELLEKMGLKEVQKAIVEMVTLYDTGKFSEVLYEQAFEDYLELCRPVFQKLEMICIVKPDLREIVIKTVCVNLVSEIRREVMDSKKHRWFGKRSLQLDSYKMKIVGFLNPSVLNMKLRISEEFCENLHEEWMKEFPKDPYQIATVENILEGFNQSWFYFG